MKKTKLKFDLIGNWSEIKLDIIKDYAGAYSTILAANNQRKLKFSHVYVDAFAGAGKHISKKTGEFIPGSPTNALQIEPKFNEYHLIDLDDAKIDSLKEIARNRKDVWIYHGDCNQILLEQVFPRIHYSDYKRGLCILDPYGLHLNWKVIEAAGQMKTIDMFLNFPVADMNRNVLWRSNLEDVDQADIDRMNAFWGDESWRDVAYTSENNLFGYLEKESNMNIAEGFRKRLKKIAGFNYVPEPMPMRNSNGAVIYYLFFASQKSTAQNIVDDIFKKHLNRGLR